MRYFELFQNVCFCVRIFFSLFYVFVSKKNKKNLKKKKKKKKNCSNNNFFPKLTQRKMAKLAFLGKFNDGHICLFGGSPSGIEGRKMA